MDMYKLTKKEERENVFITLGRLRASIIASNSEQSQRSIALLNKISDDVSQMDLDLPASKKVVF